MFELIYVGANAHRFSNKLLGFCSEPTKLDGHNFKRQTYTKYYSYLMVCKYFDETVFEYK
jgi:hypothetical protein